MDLESRITRRHLLRWAGLTGLSFSLGGCGLTTGSPVLVGLKQSIPPSLINQFTRRHPNTPQLRLVDTRQQLFDQLQTYFEPPEPAWWDPFGWFPSAAPPIRVALLGSDWLDQAILRHWLQPLDPDALGSIWPTLPQQWQQATQRPGPDGQQQLWGVPWRWGVTAIGYNRRYVQEPIRDWADLWRPDLRHRLTLPDHPREVIGLTLKKLGRSYNSGLPAQDPELEAELARLDQQVLAYTSSSYLQMLRLDDSWVAVGWSQDLYETQRNFPDIEVVIPASGSAIWFDLWVVPRQQEHVDPVEVLDIPSGDPGHELGFLPDWFDFVLDPSVTPLLINLSQIASVQPEFERQQLSKALQLRPDLSEAGLTNAEIWQPLSVEQLDRYRSLWLQLRRA